MAAERYVLSCLFNEEIYLLFGEKIRLMGKATYSDFILNVTVWFSFLGKHLVLQWSCHMPEGFPFIIGVTFSSFNSVILGSQIILSKYSQNGVSNICLSKPSRNGLGS